MLTKAKPTERELVRRQLSKEFEEKKIRMDLLEMHLESWDLPWPDHMREENKLEIIKCAQEYWGPEATVDFSEKMFTVKHPDGRLRHFSK